MTSLDVRFGLVLDHSNIIKEIYFIRIKYNLFSKANP
jgi:hypothetical protein